MVEQQFFLGDLIEADVTLNGQPVRVALDPYLDVATGEVITITFPPERCVVVPTSGVRRS